MVTLGRKICVTTFNNRFSRSAIGPAGESAIILAITGAVFQIPLLSGSEQISESLLAGRKREQTIAFGCAVNLVTHIRRA